VNYSGGYCWLNQPAYTKDGWAIPSSCAYYYNAPPTVGRPPLPQMAPPRPPAAEVALDGLLLRSDQINSAMGATGMTVSGTFTSSSDPHVSDKACLPLNGPAKPAAYAGSGWSAMRAQDLHEPDERFTHFVQQDVVLFSSAQDAGAFFTASTQAWPACANRQYTEAGDGKPDKVWTVGSVSNTNGTLSATQTHGGGDNYWSWMSCQRALTVDKDVAIDVEACSRNRSDAQSDSAVNIAHQIAAIVATR
jgi:serine/threonine-protein kinase